MMAAIEARRASASAPASSGTAAKGGSGWRPRGGSGTSAWSMRAQPARWPSGGSPSGVEASSPPPGPGTIEARDGCRVDGGGEAVVTGRRGGGRDKAAAAAARAAATGDGGAVAGEGCASRMKVCGGRRAGDRRLPWGAMGRAASARSASTRLASPVGDGACGDRPGMAGGGADRAGSTWVRGCGDGGRLGGSGVREGGGGGPGGDGCSGAAEATGGGDGGAGQVGTGMWTVPISRTERGVRAEWRYEAPCGSARR